MKIPVKNVSFRQVILYAEGRGLVGSGLLTEALPMAGKQRKRARKVTVDLAELEVIVGATQARREPSKGKLYPMKEPRTRILTP